MARNWAITVGINKYAYLRPLNYAVRDAESVNHFFGQEMKFHQLYHFTDKSQPIPQDYGPALVSTPTNTTLRRFLRTRFEEPFLSDGDNLWFFFAGHGIRDQGRDYLLPIDGDVDDLQNSAIPIHYISECLRRSGADNVILLIDACRSYEGRQASLDVSARPLPRLETSDYVRILQADSLGIRSVPSDETQSVKPSGLFVWSSIDSAIADGNGDGNELAILVPVGSVMKIVSMRIVDGSEFLRLQLCSSLPIGSAVNTIEQPATEDPYDITEVDPYSMVESAEGPLRLKLSQLGWASGSVASASAELIESPEPSQQGACEG